MKPFPGDSFFPSTAGFSNPFPDYEFPLPQPPKVADQLKDKNIQNLFATEGAEATEGSGPKIKGQITMSGEAQLSFDRSKAIPIRYAKA